MKSDGPLWAPQHVGPAPGLVYADSVRRTAATLIDYIVAVVVTAIPYGLVGAMGQTPSVEARNLGNLVATIGFFTVFGVTAKVWNGQTVGGRLIGIRIVKRQDGSPIGWVRALLRPIGLFVVVILWFVTVVLALIDRERRTIADILAGTLVIRSIEGEPAATPAAPV